MVIPVGVLDNTFVFLYSLKPGDGGLYRVDKKKIKGREDKYYTPLTQYSD